MKLKYLLDKYNPNSNVLYLVTDGIIISEIDRAIREYGEYKVDWFTINNNSTLTVVLKESING